MLFGIGCLSRFNPALIDITCIIYGAIGKNGVLDILPNKPCGYVFGLDILCVCVCVFRPKKIVDNLPQYTAACKTAQWFRVTMQFLGKINQIE